MLLPVLFKVSMFVALRHENEKDKKRAWSSSLLVRHPIPSLRTGLGSLHGTAKWAPRCPVCLRWAPMVFACRAAHFLIEVPVGMRVRQEGLLRQWRQSFHLGLENDHRERIWAFPMVSARTHVVSLLILPFFPHSSAVQKHPPSPPIHPDSTLRSSRSFRMARCERCTKRAETLANLNSIRPFASSAEGARGRSTRGIGGGLRVEHP